MFPRIIGEKKITASVILCAFVISKNAFAIIIYHTCDSLLLHNIVITIMGMIYHKYNKNAAGHMWKTWKVGINDDGDDVTVGTLSI